MALSPAPIISVNPPWSGPIVGFPNEAVNYILCKKDIIFLYKKDNLDIIYCLSVFVNPIKNIVTEVIMRLHTVITISRIIPGDMMVVKSAVTKNEMIETFNTFRITCLK